MKKTVIFLLTMATSLSIMSTVSATATGHSSGGHASGGGHSTGHTSAGHTSGGGSRSVGRVTTSQSSRTNTRSFTRSSSQVNRAMSSRTGQKTTQSLTSNSQRLNLGGSRSYATYASHPYNSQYSVSYTHLTLPTKRIV